MLVLWIVFKITGKILSRVIPGTPNNGTPLWEASHYSHTTPIRIPKDMGMVWEASHKGVPLLGVPEKFPYSTCAITLPLLSSFKGKTRSWYWPDVSAVAGHLSIFVEMCLNGLIWQLQNLI